MAPSKGLDLVGEQHRFIINCVLFLRTAREITSSCHAPPSEHRRAAALFLNDWKSHGGPCPAGHELFQRLNTRVFISIRVCPATAKSGVNPCGHMTTRRKSRNQSATQGLRGIPELMPTDVHSALYGHSILSACAWDEQEAAVCLTLKRVQYLCSGLYGWISLQITRALNVSPLQRSQNKSSLWYIPFVLRPIKTALLFLVWSFQHLNLNERLSANAHIHVLNK